MTQKPRKGDFGELKSRKPPGEQCPQTSLEVRNRSVLILDPRLISILSILPFYHSYLGMYYSILSRHSRFACWQGQFEI